MTKGGYYYKRFNTNCKAMMFSGCVFSVLFLCVLTVAMSSGPIVLGTELNTNGMVEYLCLGLGCDTSVITDFKWVDGSRHF